MSRFADYLPKEEEKEPVWPFFLMGFGAFFLLSWLVIDVFTAAVVDILPYCQNDPFNCAGFWGRVTETYISFFATGFWTALIPASFLLLIYASVIFVFYKIYGFVFKRENWRLLSSHNIGNTVRDLIFLITGGLSLALFFTLLLFKDPIVVFLPGCYFSEFKQGAHEIVRCNGTGSILLEMVFGIFPWAIIKIKPQLIFVQFVYVSIGYLFYKGFSFIRHRGRGV